MAKASVEARCLPQGEGLPEANAPIRRGGGGGRVGGRREGGVRKGREGGVDSRGRKVRGRGGRETDAAVNIDSIINQSINQSINFRLFKNKNDIAALMFTNLSMIKQYYTIKLKVS